MLHYVRKNCEPLVPGTSLLAMLSTPRLVCLSEPRISSSNPAAQSFFGSPPMMPVCSAQMHAPPLPGRHPPELSSSCLGDPTPPLTTQHCSACSRVCMFLNRVQGRLKTGGLWWAMPVGYACGRACAGWVAALDHKTRYAAVEGRVIVVPRLAVLDEIVTGHWSLVGVQLDVEVSERSVQRDVYDIHKNTAVRTPRSEHRQSQAL